MLEGKRVEKQNKLDLIPHSVETRVQHKIQTLHG